MEPSEKSASIKMLLKGYATLLGLADRETSIRNDICAQCGNAAVNFRSEAERKDYSLTGLCQVCQDELWSSEGASL